MRALRLLFGLSMFAACDGGTTNALPDATASPGADLGAIGLPLPGASYYPAGLSAAADGTIYVGSLGTGEVTRFAPDSNSPIPFIAAGDPKGVVGMLVDGDSATLYLCAADLKTVPPGSEVRAYDRSSGALKKTYAFSSPAFCMDFALDADGNLFVSDGNGKVWRLAKGGAALALWSADPLLAASASMGVGAKGLAVEGASLYVVTFSDGRLLRIAIAVDGSAGPVTPIAVTPALRGPDGLRLDGPATLVVVEGAAGQLTRLTLLGDTAAATPIIYSLNGPTSVVRVGTTYWVNEGQVDRFFDSTLGKPTLPFRVRAVPVSGH